MSSKYYPGAIINGVELIELDTEKSTSGKKYWKYKCPTCGAIKSSSTDRIGTNCPVCAEKIRREKVSKIGKNNFKDLTGQTFGYLTAIAPTNKRENRKVVWKCKCVCGKEVEVVSTNLTAGRTKSCGCKRNEMIGAAVGHIEKEVHAGDLVNNTLILDLYFKKDSRNFREAWVKCRCQFCGKEFDVRYTSLKDGKTQSCGCAKKSVREKKIETLLKNANIQFEREKTFKDCYYSNSCAKSRFDFYVDNSYLIEYDGEQHFIASGSIFTPEQVELTQKRDEYKNNWCKEHHIPLIRIPYVHKNNICLEDLLLETSKFVVIKGD